MSDYIDTREGWREVDMEYGLRSVPALIEFNDRGEPLRRWVREEPVPPLPTEPYTVIRVTPPAKYEAGISMLYVHDGIRYAMVSLNSWLTLDSVEDAADFGIEVLSEPRAVTAKAVLDAAADFFDITWTPAAAAVIAREFGVTDEAP